MEIPDEVRVSVITWVRETATKPSAEIEAFIQEEHDKLLRALDGLSEAQAAHKPSPDDWSVLETMAHVVTVKQLTLALSASLAQGELPVDSGPEWEEPSWQDGVTIATPASLVDAKAVAEASHQQLLGFVRALETTTINREKVFKHFLFGAFNSPEWAAFQCVHDEVHTPQIAQIKASPGFPSA